MSLITGWPGMDTFLLQAKLNCVSQFSEHGRAQYLLDGLIGKSTTMLDQSRWWYLSLRGNLVDHLKPEILMRGPVLGAKVRSRSGRPLTFCILQVCYVNLLLLKNLRNALRSMIVYIWMLIPYHVDASVFTHGVFQIRADVTVTSPETWQTKIWSCTFARNH